MSTFVKQLTATCGCLLLMSGAASSTAMESESKALSVGHTDESTNVHHAESEKTTIAEPFTHHRFGEIYFAEDLHTITLNYQVISEGEDSCQYVAFDKYPSLAFMVIEGTIVNATLDVGLYTDIDSIFKHSIFQALATGRQSLAAFRKQYPQVEVYDHEYLPGVYLHWYSIDKTRAVVVEYVNERIDRLKVGLVPSVLWVEGCA
jgi:hypothetical protein